MALNVTQWAREQHTGDMAAKATLMALAERADPRGYCHPSYSKLAADMDCDPSTVKRAVKRLVLLGLVELVIRYEDTRDGKRRQTSNRFHLMVPPGQSAPGAERPGGQSASPPRAESEPPRGTQRPTRNQSIEPINEPSSSVGGDRETSAPSDDDDDRFRRARGELVDGIMATRSPENPAAYRAKVERSVEFEHGAELRRLLDEHPSWSPAQIAAARLDDLGRRRPDAAPAVAASSRLDCARAHGANIGAHVPDDELDDYLAAEGWDDDAARAAFLDGRSASIQAVTA